MTNEIFVFAVSGVLIALFIALKSLQVEQGKVFIFPRMRQRFESRLFKVGRGIAFVRSKINSKTLYIVFHSVLVLTKRVSVTVYRNVDQLAHLTMRRIKAEAEQRVERPRSL